MGRIRSSFAADATGFARLAACALLVLTIAACTSGGSPQPPQTKSGKPASEEDIIAGMQIVDCLLPGQLRSLGKGTYLTARRPIKTTAKDCNIRGGEYTAYDRADYKTALKVWMPAAKAGDPKAQVNVGEIFEKGLGTEPNYEAAAVWYRKAAEQGNEQGLFNLGTLYEQGLGVEKNQVKALNLYRQAWGLPEDSIMYQETARKEREALKKELTQKLQAKKSQIQALEKQVQSLQQKLEQRASAAGGGDELTAELNSLKDLLGSLRDSRQEVKQELASLPKFREPAKTAESKGNQSSGSEGPKATRIDDMDFGQYYALVIGNRDYMSLQDLDTPVNDARAIADILENRYGFRVQLLIDADRLTIMKSINELHDVLDENDNLLVYYAGHGSLVDVGKRDTGYWLPTNAEPPPNDSYWVPNEFITNHLGRLNAKRVLVIADSCYGGLLSSAPGHVFLNKNDAGATEEYIRYKLPRRSRLLLSSGGNKPVIDSVGDEHSVFARELIDVLTNNDTIMTAPELFAKIKKPVIKRAKANDFKQEPEFKTIKGAGHEVGDFFFVPRDMTKPVASRGTPN